MTKGRSVSVIIPVYNGDTYLAEAIESVLAQAHTAEEIIIVDDGSTDKSASIAKSFDAHVKYYFKNHGGPAAARNYAIQLARGDLLAFLDADDIWLEEKLVLQIEALNKNEEVSMVFGHVQQFYSPELNIPQEVRENLESKCMAGYYLGTMLIRSDDFFRVGMFSEVRRTGEFMDWYSRAKEAGLKEIMLSGILAKRRIHGLNMGIRERSVRSDYAAILKNALDRRRKKG